MHLINTLENKLFPRVGKSSPTHHLLLVNRIQLDQVTESIYTPEKKTCI